MPFFTRKLLVLHVSIFSLLYIPVLGMVSLLVFKVPLPLYILVER